MSIIVAEAARYRAVGEVLEVVRDFEARTISRERWTHAAHLTVALWYLLQYDWPEAVARVRRGLNRLNEVPGMVLPGERGYHETLTLFWLRFIRSFLASERNEGRSIVALANELVGAARSKVALEYYTRERLFSPEAAARWVEPDLKPLPF